AEKVSPFTDPARAESMLVVYPNGIDRKWNDGRADAKGNPVVDSEDVRFVEDMLDLFAGTGKVDMRRWPSVRGFIAPTPARFTRLVGMPRRCSSFGSKAAVIPGRRTWKAASRCYEPVTLPST